MGLTHPSAALREALRAGRRWRGPRRDCWKTGRHSRRGRRRSWRGRRRRCWMTGGHSRRGGRSVSAQGNRLAQWHQCRRIKCEASQDRAHRAWQWIGRMAHQRHRHDCQDEDFHANQADQKVTRPGLTRPHYPQEDGHPNGEASHQSRCKPECVKRIGAKAIKETLGDREQDRGDANPGSCSQPPALGR